MPITNAPFFKYAFAQSGDKTPIPQEQDPKGKISYQIGFGPIYSKDPAADGDYILRDNFNQLMFDTTNAIRQMQINGANLWRAEVANNGGYPAGAVVLVKMQMNGVIDSGTSFVQHLNYYQPFVSMIEANRDEPTAANAYKSWWALDGNPLFGVITRLSNAGLTSQTPSGYLEIGGATPNAKYNFSNYPRVQRALTGGYGSEYFTNNGDNTFSIVDLRGRFPRLWSNGGNIDSGRTFNTLQGDAIRNMTGSTFFVGESTQQVPAIGVANANGIMYGSVFGSQVRGLGFGSQRLINTTLNINVSRQVPTATENRPYNFNFRMFIKV